MNNQQDLYANDKGVLEPTTFSGIYFEDDIFLAVVETMSTMGFSYEKSEEIADDIIQRTMINSQDIEVS